MSVSVDGTTITLTRGDTLRVAVSITVDGEAYVPQSGDSVRFALRENVQRGSTYREWVGDELLVKTIPIDTMMLELEPEDTKDLPFGTYVYDIQLTMADGTVDTFITKAKFKLTEEVE